MSWDHNQKLIKYTYTYVKDKVIEKKNLVLSAFRLETILCWSTRVLTRKSGFDKIKTQYWVSLSLQLKLSIVRVFFNKKDIYSARHINKDEKVYVEGYIFSKHVHILEGHT